MSVSFSFAGTGPAIRAREVIALVRRELNSKNARDRDHGRTKLRNHDC
ncbi:hypothetical protein [Streptomyces sp. URMC 125]|uniref:Uncharacterized protein n=1 Tax=Streptomyces desertarenae TaxID=2666184 RepID=A0ABW4PRJ9_9ACTN